jgi:hypothetical protein
MKEVFCAANRKGSKLKEQAKPIPEKLIKILLTENIDVSDVIKLKEMLNDWITSHRQQKNKRIKNKKQTIWNY